MSPRAALIGLIVLVAISESSFRPAKAQVGFAPVVGSFPNGVNLDVTPVVSHDRRYVRMSVNFQSTAIEGFDSALIPAAVGGNGNGAPGGGFGAGGGRGGGGGGGAGRLGFMGRPTSRNAWGNALAPIAVAKGPAISLDFPDENAPTATAAMTHKPKPTGPLLADRTARPQGRSKSAKSRRN